MKSGEYLRQIREEKKFSLRQLSIKSGVSHTQIADVEKGINYGTKEKLNLILNSLRMSQEEKEKFFELQDYEKTPEQIKIKLEKLILKNQESKKRKLMIQENEFKIINFPVFLYSDSNNVSLNLKNPFEIEQRVVSIKNKFFEKYEDDLYIIKIENSSMESFKQGDVLIITSNYQVLNNNDFYVVTYKDKIFIRKIIDNNRYIQLISDNSDKVNFPDIVIIKGENDKNFFCHGKILQLERNF